MKRKISQLIKKNGGELISYKSKMSDMGWQTLSLTLKTKEGIEKDFTDGYLPRSGKPFIISEITKLLK